MDTLKDVEILNIFIKPVVDPEGEAAEVVTAVDPVADKGPVVLATADEAAPVTPVTPKNISKKEK